MIPTRFPTVGLFDLVADPADLDAVYAVESLTNPRLRDAVGELVLVPLEERISGPGTTPIMAAFTHLNPVGSRFSDGTYGVYYAADRLRTAMAEVAYHHGRFLRLTREPALEVDFTVLHAGVNARLHDLRGQAARYAAELSPVSYAASQVLGRALRAAGSWGIAYDSVRDAGGVCVGLFRPRALAPVGSTLTVGMRWDGQAFSHWYEKGRPTALRALQ